MDLTIKEFHALNAIIFDETTTGYTKISVVEKSSGFDVLNFECENKAHQSDILLQNFGYSDNGEYIVTFSSNVKTKKPIIINYHHTAVENEENDIDAIIRQALPYLDMALEMFKQEAPIKSVVDAMTGREFQLKFTDGGMSLSITPKFPQGIQPVPMTSQYPIEKSK